MRYIDADKIEFHAPPIQWKFREYIAIQSEVDAISEADVEPVRHGYWAEHTDQFMYINGKKQIVKYCSECGETAPYNAVGKQFYPARCYCGAKMDGKENRE